MAELGPHTLLVAVPLSAPASSPRRVVAAPERLAAPCPHCDTGASAFSGMFRPARQQPRLSAGQGQPWHALGVGVY